LPRKAPQAALSADGRPLKEITPKPTLQALLSHFTAAEIRDMARAEKEGRDYYTAVMFT
jgi:hypothetical protein